MTFTCIFFGLLFIGAGLAFASGKGHVHLSAWKSLSEMEKAAINIRPLCRNIGSMMALSGAIFLLKGLYAGFDDHHFLICMICWLILAGCDVCFIEKSSRYRRA